MTTSTRQFHEFGFSRLATLPDDDVKAEYEAAFKADPVNGLRFGYHIQNRAFAGELFKQAARVAPASAFADMHSYGFKLPVNGLYEIRDDAQFKETLRTALLSNHADAIAKAEKDAASAFEKLGRQGLDTASMAHQTSVINEQLSIVKRLDVKAFIAKQTVEALAQRKEYQENQAAYPWLAEVLVEAAMASPAAAKAYENHWKDLPFAAAITEAIASAERPLPTNDDGVGHPTSFVAKVRPNGAGRDGAAGITT